VPSRASEGNGACALVDLARGVLNPYVVAVVRLPMLPLTAAQSGELVADANRIRAVIAC